MRKRNETRRGKEEKEREKKVWKRRNSV